MIPAHTIVDGLQPCGLPPCPHHSSLCAYHGDEPDRCPFCHCLWSVILDRLAREGQHSCEFKGGRHTHRPDLPITAERMRRDAAEKPQDWIRSTHCPHRVADIGRERFAALGPSQGFPEGMVPA